MQKRSDEDKQTLLKQDRKTSELYQAMLQQSVFGYALFQVDYDKCKEMECLTYLEVNESYEKLIGAKAYELIGKRMNDSFPGMVIPDTTRRLIMQAILEKKDKLDFKHYIEPLHRWFQVKVMYLTEKLIALQIHDLTPELEQLVCYENFFQVDLDMLCIGDKSGKLLKVSNEWRNALGYLPDDIENRFFMEFVHPEDREATEKAAQLMENEREIFKYINRFRAKNGSYHYIEWKARPQGEYIYAAARDITERIELEHSLKEKNTLIEAILSNAPLGIWITDLEKQSSYINKYVEDNFDLTEEEKKLCRNSDLDAFNKNGPQRYDEIVTFKDGQKHVLETVKTKLTLADSDKTGVLGFGLDITKRKEGEEALRISEAKYRLLTETTSDVIWVVKLPDTKITYISPTVYSMTGYTVDEIMNRRLEEFISMDTIQAFTERINRMLEDFYLNEAKAQNIIIETQLICKDGRSIWTEASASLRYNQMHEIEMVGVSRNIENRKKYEKEVLYLSYHDQLTGLYNRRFYEEELKNINTDVNYPISLVMADVNGLKLTNDAFGHAFGDKLLITFADILKQECRSGDIIARIGGDEFVLLLPRTNTIQTEKIVGRIRKIIKKTVIEKVMLSVSFGWKTKHSQEEEFESIYKSAEDAMYRNKLWDGESYKSDTIKMITKSLFEKSPREQLHSERVSAICKKIGSAMEMDENGINELGLVGLLHDIGKIGISEVILNKTDHLTEAEREEMKRHPEIGYHILRSVNEFTDIAEYVLAHHEQCNGKGYPKGLKEEEIPLQSRILLVADAYDEMTGSFGFKNHYTPSEALEELKRNAGVQFNREIVDIFAEKVFPELV